VQLRAAEREHRAGREVCREDRHAVDLGAVAAAEIVDVDAARVHDELAVKPRHRGIGQDEIGRFVRTDDRALAARDERDADIGPRDDAQLELRDRVGPAAVDGERRASVRSIRHPCGNRNTPIPRTHGRPCGIEATP
jgi:hypothetical protein